ncbi:unnamed protein product [Linum tenue]|uniref:Uncharacterized protein n=1 Tax=Linum tenue TaxID=586396 RepID=A0AAV0PDL6_9ROSI|nr:unnamed protein product [Linum tenue]
MSAQYRHVQNNNSNNTTSKAAASAGAAGSGTSKSPLLLARHNPSGLLLQDTDCNVVNSNSNRSKGNNHSFGRHGATTSVKSPHGDPLFNIAPSPNNKMKSPPLVSPEEEPCQLNGVGEDYVEFNYTNNRLPSSSSQSALTMDAVIGKKYPVYARDISRGEEKVKIPLVNEFSSNIHPLKLPNILYISTNMVHKDAHIDFSLARLSDDNCCSSCVGDCLSSDLPCGCAAETGGEFAYTPGGVLKGEFLEKCVMMNKEPQRKHYYYCEVCPLVNDLSQKGKKKVKACRGHLTRKFIKECWSKCGCSKRCGNRVVQKGIQVPLQVFATSEGKGWGVRSVTALKKGTFICEYIGEIVTNQELYERNKERAAKKEEHTYPVLLDADWGSERILKDEEALCLDATEFGNVGRFINHRCGDSNLIEIPVEVESPDHHYYHVAFFTVRDVEAMEELTWDYGIEFDDIYHPIKAFKCKCGSKYCRNKQKIQR